MALPGGGVSCLHIEQCNCDAAHLLGFLPKLVASPAEKTTLHFRRLLRREPLCELEREQFEVELSRMNKYNEEEEMKAQELHVMDIRLNEEKMAGVALAQEIRGARSGAPMI